MSARARENDTRPPPGARAEAQKLEQPMSTITSPLTSRPLPGENPYPTSDGRPMGETDLHRNVMFAAIETLKLHYAGQLVYVSGNILLFYKPGNRRRHVSPDVLVVRGLEQRDRQNYLLWEEGRPPQVVIEVTSASTRDEDLEDKFEIYRDEVQVAEYFLYDPRGEYLLPALQGYRRIGGQYVRIEPESGRLPSLELGLCLEQQARGLRFYDPARGAWLPTLQEAHDQAEAEKRQAVANSERAAAALQRAEAEVERLRQQLESMRRQGSGGGPATP
jgi:Uma2 family endonuclease